MSTPARRTGSAPPLGDLVAGLRSVDYWSTLAWFDIRGRYRRTLLGPFWSVLNSVVFVTILASVYALLWKIELTQFLPYVAAGYFTWTFLATMIGESCAVFHANGETLKTMPLSPMALLLRVVTRNAIVFAHNVLVFIAIALLFGVSLATAWLAMPGIVLVALTGLGCGTAAAFLCSRYRDFEQVIQSVLQVLFFISPILWMEKVLPAHARVLADANPVVHLLRVVRDPLLGAAPPPAAYLPALWVCLCALAVGMASYLLFRRRLMQWL